MKTSITDLRAHLFATLEALQDKEAPMELDRAKVIAEVCQTVINSAKVEVDYLKATGQPKDSGFLTPAPALPAPTLALRRVAAAAHGGEG